MMYMEIEKEVHRLITKRICKAMLDYLERKNPTLWGEDKPRFFTKRCFILAKYHDIKRIGYNKLLNKVHMLGFKINHKSLKYNTKTIRRVLAEWGREQVRFGDKSD